MPKTQFCGFKIHLGMFSPLAKPLVRMTIQIVHRVRRFGLVFTSDD